MHVAHAYAMVLSLDDAARGRALGLSAALEIAALEAQLINVRAVAAFLAPSRATRPDDVTAADFLPAWRGVAPPLEARLRVYSVIANKHVGT